MYDIYVSPACELYHHGIKGMKWGVRRYQNPDGSLTDEGRKRYLKGKSRFNYESAATRKLEKKYGKDSEQYKRSAELDEEMAVEYRNSSLASRIGGNLLYGGPTGYQTYKLSRATGRGVLNSFLRGVIDLNYDHAVAAAGLGIGAATAGLTSYLAAQKGLSKLASMTTSQLQNTFTYIPGVGTVRGGSAAAIRDAANKVANAAVDKGVEVGTRAQLGAAASRYASGPMLQGQGHEISLQQKWLRNNYINKGSYEEQVRKRQEDRERRRAARNSN